MIRQEFKRSKNLNISATFQCHAENMQQVSDGSIQMFVP